MLAITFQRNFQVKLYSIPIFRTTIQLHSNTITNKCKENKVYFDLNVIKNKYPRIIEIILLNWIYFWYFFLSFELFLTTFDLLRVIVQIILWSYHEMEFLFCLNPYLWFHLISRYMSGKSLNSVVLSLVVRISKVRSCHKSNKSFEQRGFLYFVFYRLFWIFLLLM